MFNAKILADSIANGVRLTTFEATFPRFILAEVNTHRMLSRNSASSRAIPIEKRIKAIRENPFVPEAFGANQRGMQSGDVLDDREQTDARAEWAQAMRNACWSAEKLAKAGVHKQWANRLIEPFGWQTAIITATEWENFFNLRAHPDAQPEFRKLAEMMRKAMDESDPIPRVEGDWHLPLIFEEDMEAACGMVPGGDSGNDVDELLCKISAGRCARVSYLTHDGKRDLAADILLCERLQSSGHMSPLEHVACVGYHEEDFTGTPITCLDDGNSFVGRFVGNFRAPWVQYRKMLPNEAVFRGGQ